MIRSQAYDGEVDVEEEEAEEEEVKIPTKCNLVVLPTACTTMYMNHLIQ